VKSHPASEASDNDVEVRANSALSTANSLLFPNASATICCARTGSTIP